jgi:thioredoxin
MDVNAYILFCLCVATLTACAPSVDEQACNDEQESIPEQSESFAEQKAIAKNLLVLHDLVDKDTTAQSALDALLSSHAKVVVDFYADWCGPCREFSPIFESVASRERDVLFVKINVDSAQKVASKYGVRGIPLIMFFKNGKQVHQKSGRLSSKELHSMIDEKLRA